MLKTLVIITSNYPYGVGEQFLETELPYLARFAERILLVPHKNRGSPRSIPGNATVTDLLATRADRHSVNAKLALAAATLATDASQWKANLRYTRLLLVAAYYRRIGRDVFSDLLQPYQLLDPGTVFYSYWFYPITAALVDLKRRYPGMRIVTRAHGGDLYEEVHGIPEFPYRSGIINELDCIFSISEHGKAHLESHYGARNVEVSRLGVLGPDGIAPGRKRGPIVLVSCSALTPVKRVDRIMQAVLRVSRENPGLFFRWLHIGDGPLRGAISAAAAATLKGSKNLSYAFLGQRPNRWLRGFYSRHRIDCFINLSASEGIPVSIMEALSFGIPVIATNVGGVPEIMAGGCGVLLGSNPKEEDVVAAIVRLAAPETANEFRGRARDAWAVGYDASVNYLLFGQRLVEIGTRDARQ